MIRGISFQTRARTVDHLGREQIADTPTAISELWKNAYDAYARRVELNIYDGTNPVAVIVDDGHGMNRDEFVNRWLVVGTESKTTTTRTSVEDRNGLRPRTRQGQKGIGRLSCANLGPILLFISKRSNSNFVAALVDWRLFENPFLNLSDLLIPVTEFEKKEQLFEQLPNLVAELVENIEGGGDNERKRRIKNAWSTYDELQSDIGRQLRENGILESNAAESRPPSEEILTTLQAIPFEERQLRQWTVWSSESSHGTALLVSGINYDLRVQLDERIADTSADHAKTRFFETLSSFVDPFVDLSLPHENIFDPQFTYAVNTWSGNTQKLILGSEKQFDLHTIEPLEHQITGTVDAAGIFKGRIKAFGEWLPNKYIIDPPKNLTIPKRTNVKLGPFRLFIAAMEFSLSNTTHSKEEFQYFQDLAEKYAGFMVYRDGLRVLPFGRTDNDFFEIESRRSKSAGREFWNHRQMFGRLAVSRSRNPNLKDKAGREGLLDNRAAKTLRALVSNILMQSARRFFGSASDIRQRLLPEIQEANKQQRAAESRNKLRKKQRREFQNRLKALSQELPEFLQEVSMYSAHLEIREETDISDAQSALESLRERLTDFRLPGAPKNLGTLEEKYIQYREDIGMVQAEINSLSDFIDNEIERINPTQPKELLEKQLARNAAFLHNRIRGWKKSIEKLQKSEFDRLHELIEQRNKIFHSEATPLIHRLETGELGYSEISKMLELLKLRLDEENAEMFVPYIGALESLRESIDLEHLATFGMEELGELRNELERLNSLAQLGIAVEITGHELQSYDEIIGAGLRRLPDEVRKSKAAKDIEFGYEGLTDQLRFLSPLRLAGQRIQKWITGEEIFKYLTEFFGVVLAKNKIEFSSSDSFNRFRVFDQKSRLLPVFINLVNNSVYWLSVSENETRRIILDIVGSEVVVSDNGPGVDSEDINNLFTLFFTKKIRGGRGVGLYLSRANLTAGGHRIRYETSNNKMPLSGANFLIEFRGAEFDGK